MLLRPGVPPVRTRRRRGLGAAGAKAGDLTMHRVHLRERAWCDARRLRHAVFVPENRANPRSRLIAPAGEFRILARSSHPLAAGSSISTAARA